MRCAGPCPIGCYQRDLRIAADLGAQTPFWSKNSTSLSEFAASRIKLARIYRQRLTPNLAALGMVLVARGIPLLAAAVPSNRVADYTTFLLVE
ncbi:hypothetical protein BZL29_7907 [Mycobacterium kansasii]|uniref:Uncharacterized protein n=1 Tax=Mycobacterium kansasii TaxID=1768 RepID=A0A1V3WE76_MYCKA|nr:hypothetical protein BZL29_7907 [Mycobacterium kansasii]